MKKPPAPASSGDAPTRRICFVVAVPATAVAFLNPHFKVLTTSYEVDLAGSFMGEERAIFSQVEVVPVKIERRLSPLNDARAFASLVRSFRAEAYDMVISVTPKAGLLGMSAARLSRCPNRLHWFTGQVWANRSGLVRRVLKAADRLTAAQATIVLVDSPSQREFLIHENVADSQKAFVLGEGSICGVNTDRFTPDAEAKEGVRMAMGVPSEARIVLFVGRLTRDKGVLDLARAFAFLPKDVYLVLVGPDEGQILQAVRDYAGDAASRIIAIGASSTPQSFMAAADVFCMPSYREGFGLSVIEAAACGVPAVASNIYGLSDAVVDGVTGLLYTPGSVDGLARSVRLLLGNEALRQSMGDRARSRVHERFSEVRLTDALLRFLTDIVPPK